MIAFVLLLSLLSLLLLHDSLSFVGLLLLVLLLIHDSLLLLLLLSLLLLLVWLYDSLSVVALLVVC